MTSRILIASLAVLFAGVVSGQDSVNLSGTVDDNEEIVHVFALDFGASAQTANLTLEIGATSGSSGLSASLVDIDELAANGSASAIVANGDTGTGTFTINQTTPSYDGVRYFAVQLRVTSQDGPSDYDGDLSTADLPAGAITETGSLSLPNQAGDIDLLGRGKRYAVQTLGAGETTRDMQVDFGSTSQAVTFWGLGVAAAGGNTGSIEVFEVDGNGAETLLGTLDMSIVNEFEDEANFTTSSRTGVVTIRIKINSDGAGIFVGQFVVPSAATTDVQGSSGGGSGGDDDEGCTTGESRGWLMLLALLAVGAVAGRRLRQRA